MCGCIFSAVLSSYLLGETLNVLGKLGCLLCLLGSVLLVIHAPQEQEVTSLQDMTQKLLEPGENRDLIASIQWCRHCLTLGLLWQQHCDSVSPQTPTFGVLFI